MKFALTWYTVSVMIASLVICLLFWLNNPLSLAALRFSPLPSFLTLADNSQVTTLDLWKPTGVLGAHVGYDVPDITAKSAYAYDITTDQVLFTKNAGTRLPMASLTKIMTAIVALEHKRPDDTYIVRGRDLVGEDSMGLTAGESLSLEELLYGLILHSGNDAAEVLADNFPDGREAFITNMNLKAQSLGLINTHFSNPTGLEGDGEQFTTAEDLVVITRYALTNFPLFAQVAATFDYYIPPSSTHAAYSLENETNLLTSYPGVKGIKTGYTPEAGLCLVTYLDYGGHKILAVLLGSDDRRGEMKEILDYSLTHVGVTPPQHD